MKKSLIIFLLISIINSFLFAQNGNSYVIDSLIAVGNYTQALKKAQLLVEKDSLVDNSWMLLGKINRLNQRYTDAIVAYNNANALNPDNNSILLVLAKTYKLSGNQVKAAKTYEVLLELDSTNTAAQINLSAIYLKQNKFKKAFIIFRQLHMSDTLNSEYVRQMGYCKYKNTEVLKAFELYKMSYELNNKNLKTIYWLANIYANSQKYDTATAIIDHAIIDFPDNGRLYASRGNVFFKQNHHYRSVDDYQKALELEYKSYTLIKNFGKSLFVIKKYDKAIEILESLIIRDTVDFQVCNYLGSIYNVLGNYDKALLFYKYSIDILTPEPLAMASVYRGMSKSYAGKGQYYKQIDYIKKRSKQQALIHPGYPTYSQFLEMAKIYEENINDKKLALKYYQKYWEAIKDWNYSYEHKEKVLAKINHLKEDLHFQN